jgi:hypothetical protein
MKKARLVLVLTLLGALCISCSTRASDEQPKEQYATSIINGTWLPGTITQEYIEISEPKQFRWGMGLSLPNATTEIDIEAQQFNVVWRGLHIESVKQIDKTVIEVVAHQFAKDATYGGGYRFHMINANTFWLEFDGGEQSAYDVLGKDHPYYRFSGPNGYTALPRTGNMTLPPKR